MNFTKQSKLLMSFFHKNKYLNDVPLANKTKGILKELYQDLLEAYKNIQKLSFKANVKRINHVSQIIMPRNFNIKSFPEPVRRHIHNHSLSEISYSFSLYGRNIKIYFIVESETPKLSVYDKYVKLIAMWLYVLNLYSPKECVNTIKIYLYFTSLQKTLPISNINVLDENNVNTAFTTTCPVDSEIVIFRKEEWFKVFIHETFHNFGLDFSIMNDDVITKCILSIFPVNSEVNAYESYTEFWAEIINVLIGSFLNLKNKVDINQFLSKAEFYINMERRYSFFQMVKTLRFMGIRYKDLYSKTDTSIVARENLYKEKSNVLSYYILKTILLNNFQGFLSWCDKHNFSLLNFNKSIRNLNEFCDFIKKNYKTKDMIESVYRTEEFLSSVENKKVSNGSYLLYNMRMSVCELG